MANNCGLANSACGKTAGVAVARFSANLAVAVCVLLFSGYALANDSPNTPDKPNVLFIAIDDLRPELGCYGAGHIHSPNIDKLSAQGVQFNRAYCQFPVCGPSRASLLSGLYPTGNRYLDNSALVEREAAELLTLPGTFRLAGYHTVANGKIYHYTDDSAGQSWSEPPFSLVSGKKLSHMTYFDKESANYIGGTKNRGPFFEIADVPDDKYIDGQTCQKTIEDLQRLAQKEQPFFLACGLVRPHLPFYAPKKYWDIYDRNEIELADNRFLPEDAPMSLRGAGEIRSYHDRGVTYNSTEFHRVARHGYYACVSYADALVGRLLASLEDLGIRDNTIVVLWGDHGWQLGEHDFWAKNTLLHKAIRSPLIISAPGMDQNVGVDGIVELIDIFPTLCELAGVNSPEHLEGVSMAPLMQDPSLPGKQAAYIRDTRGSAVVTADYIYTQYRGGEHMLFDHGNDPDENENVAGHPKYAQTISEMKELLEQRQERAAEVARREVAQ